MNWKNKILLLTVWWFIFSIVVGMGIIIFTPGGERVSTKENRRLQSAPELSASAFFEGSYTSEFEAFLSDSMPVRNVLIDISDKLLGLFSLNTSEDLFYLDTTQEEAAGVGLDGQAIEDDDGGAQQTGQDYYAVSAEHEASEGDAIFELVRKDGGTELITLYPYENIVGSAKNLELYADLIPEDGRVIFTTVPFPAPARRMYRNQDIYSGWQTSLPSVLDSVTSDKIICVDTAAILEQHLLDGEELFLFNNHQWNVRGAYYVFCDMIERLGLTPTPFDEYAYRVNKVQSYDTDTYELLYPLAPAKNYHVDAFDRMTEIDFMAYDSADNSAYLNGYAMAWKKVETGFHTGRNALVIGDCIDMAIAPFLLPYYDNVHITEIRETGRLDTPVIDMIKWNGISDIYIIYSEANSVNSKTLLRTLGVNLYN